MANKRRYLVITENFPPRKGGSNLWFDEVYRRIGDKSTHVVTNDQPGAASYDASHPNCIHRLSLTRREWLRPESLFIYLKLLLKSLSLLLRHPFDAVHAGRVLSEGLVGLTVARLAGLPVIIYAHGEEITTWRQPTKFKFMRFVYCQADQVIANSEFTREELLKLGVLSERISMIYPGVDVERFWPGLEAIDYRQSLGTSPESKLILSVGRLSRRKGFDYVLQSLPVLMEKGLDVHYGIIGIGDDRDYLTRQAQKLGIASRFHLLGHVPPQDLPRWYNAADVFAMPNRVVNQDTEGFGMVFLEAAACGKPAIAGKAGGTGSAVIDNVTGLRVEGASVEAISNGLERILKNKEFARQLGQNGRARAVECFSWDEVARKTLLLDQAIISPSRSAPLR